MKILQVVQPENADTVKIEDFLGFRLVLIPAGMRADLGLPLWGRGSFQFPVEETGSREFLLPRNPIPYKLFRE